MVSNQACYNWSQMFASNMHQNEWIQVWFSKKFLGKGLPLPCFFSGFALGSGFALNSQALCSFDSGFALDSRALHSLDSGFALNFGLENLVCPRPPINSWIRQCLSVTIDDEFKMDLHVGCMVRSCFYQLRQVRTIVRQSLSDNATRRHSFIVTGVDYCNSVLSGVACVAYDVRWRREARAEGGLTASLLTKELRFYFRELKASNS